MLGLHRDSNPEAVTVAGTGWDTVTGQVRSHVLSLGCTNHPHTYVEGWGQHGSSEEGYWQYAVDAPHSLMEGLGTDSPWHSVGGGASASAVGPLHYGSSHPKSVDLALHVE